MISVIKRDKETVGFQLTKLTASIEKALQAAGNVCSQEISELLSLRTTADFQPKICEGELRTEEIKASAARVLEQAGYTEAAGAYLSYKKEKNSAEEKKNTLLDYKDVVNSYVKVEDWRVKENSTVTYSVGGLILSNSGAVTANYWLSEIYDSEIAEAHRNADIHLHDLSMLTGYCAGWS